MRKGETGSVLLMSLIAMMVLALLMSGAFRLMGDMSMTARRTVQKHQTSAVVESVLNKLIYDMQSQFVEYYYAEPNAESFSKMDWFTDSIANSIGVDNFKYSLPPINRDVVAFWHLETGYKEQQWKGIFFDTRISLESKSEANAFYKFFVEAYYQENGKEVPGTRSSVEQISEFGFSDSEVFDYLLFSTSTIKLSGKGRYVGDIKSNSGIEYHQDYDEFGRLCKPEILGSTFSAGDNTGYYKSGFKVAEDESAYQTWSNSKYWMWTCRPKNIMGMARPFHPNAVINKDDKPWLAGGGNYRSPTAVIGTK